MNQSFLFISIRDKHGVIAQISMREGDLQPVEWRAGKRASGLLIEPGKKKILITRR